MKIYRIISSVILGLCIYMLLLPLISPLMDEIIPQLWTCPFLKITGHDCPFCGITRGIGSVYSFDIGSAGIRAMLSFLLLVTESAFRLAVIMTVSGFRKKTLNMIIGADILIHTVMAVLLIIYVIMFLITNF